MNTGMQPQQLRDQMTRKPKGGWLGWNKGGGGGRTSGTAVLIYRSLETQPAYVTSPRFLSTTY